MRCIYQGTEELGFLRPWRGLDGVSEKRLERRGGGGWNGGSQPIVWADS